MTIWGSGWWNDVNCVVICVCRIFTFRDSCESFCDYACRGTFSRIRYNILDTSNIGANDGDKLIADDVIWSELIKLRKSPALKSVQGIRILALLVHSASLWFVWFHGWHFVVIESIVFDSCIYLNEFYYLVIMAINYPMITSIIHSTNYFIIVVVNY